MAVEHHTRRKIHKASAPVGLDHDDGRYLQTALAQQQAVTHANAQRIEQLGIHPHRPRRGYAARRALRHTGRIGDTQGSAQGVARFYRFQGHQFAIAALLLRGTRHGGKALGVHHRQTQAAGLFGKYSGRGAVAGDNRIAA